MNDKLLRAELDNIVDESNDNIVVTDGLGVVLRVSENCYDIYGLEKEQLIGRSVYELEKDGIFSPSITVQVLQEHKRLQSMQKTQTGRHVMATGIPVFLDGKIERIISFSHDLTEIQQLRSEYESMQQKMEHYESQLTNYKNVNDSGIIIHSNEMQKVVELIRLTANSEAAVLLLGESGVGKSLIAREMHKQSVRKNEALIEVNCGAIPASLFESELFGYEKGAFTGASNEGKVGLIQLAHKGTLFLDEIAEMPLDLQVKLLKVIEEKKFTKVGGTKEMEVDFRLVAATNQNLETMVKEGTFRKDLFYRLNVIQIDIPSLKNRKEDILELAYFFLQKYNKKYNKNEAFTNRILESFLHYEWPGNVRELENTIERYVITSTVSFAHKNDQDLSNELNQLNGWSFIQFEEEGLTLQEALQEVEKSWLQQAYKSSKSTYEMADYLGMSQSTVVRRLKQYGIKSK